MSNKLGRFNDNRYSAEYSGGNSQTQSIDYYRPPINDNEFANPFPLYRVPSPNTTIYTAIPLITEQPQTICRDLQGNIVSCSSIEVNNDNSKTNNTSIIPLNETGTVNIIDSLKSNPLVLVAIVGIVFLVIKK